MRMRNYKNKAKQISTICCFGHFSQPLPAHCTAHSIVGDDNKLLATHMRITSVTKMEKTRLILDLIKRYPNCHLTMMSPATKRERNNYVSAMIQPGHIHSTCTNENGDIMIEGDASFTIDNNKKKEEHRSVPDSRLTGYQSNLISVGHCRFSSTIEEVAKWEKASNVDPTYPLYVLAVPFKSAVDCCRYLKLVETTKEKYKNKTYSLFTHYHKHTCDIIRANNCVTFNSMLNEAYFDEFIFLGDNPSPQLAYLKLLNTFISERTTYHHRNIMDDILLDKEHFEAEIHRSGVV